MSTPADSGHQSQITRSQLRDELGKHLDRVEETGEILYVTHHRMQCGAIVSTRDAETVELLRAPAVSPPGDVEAAAVLIESAFDQNESAATDGFLRVRRSSTIGNFVGGLATLMKELYAPIQPQNMGGRFEGTGEDGRVSISPMTLADIVLVDVAEGNGSPPPEVIPLIAGALWALQSGIDPVTWRNALGIPLVPGEPEAWVLATSRMAFVVRDFCVEDVVDLLSEAGERFGNMPPTG
ncbi:hypothetical protein [Streptomyces sp. NPDC008240]|uniref:hypothetical protein n=1 Tax=Streptomyces sp. NPDC008240 TaxID=3364822 RepID=UPI0036E7D918